jgi:adenylate cyclase, class 2
MENIEIEIKLRIDAETNIRCKSFLLENAKFIDNSREVDQYFSASNRNFLAPEYPYEWLRVREKNGKSVLNYKHWYPENSPNSTHCDEFETIISDSGALIKIFEQLDIALLIKIDKIREKFILNEKFEIALDFIENLGHFMEIEYIGEASSIIAAQEELFEIAGLLGLDLSTRDNRGYPYLMLEKLGTLNNYKNG